MPISLPNWAQHETQDYGGYGSLLENALKGYQMSRMPKQIGQEEQYRELVNRLTGHQATNEGIKSQYLPQEYEANIANTKAHTGLYGAQTRGHEIANAIEQALGMKREQSNISLHEAQRAHAQAQAETARLLAPYLVQHKIAQTEKERAKASQPILSEREKAFARAQGTQSAKAVAENNQQIGAAEDVETSLKELQELSNKNAKLFNETVGPVSGRTLKFTGTPEQKELLGQIKAASGNVAQATLAMMKGATSDRELNEVKQIKPTETDTPEAYKAKAATLLKIAGQIKNRKIYINKRIEDGATQSEAVREAMSHYPVEQFVKEAQVKTDPKNQFVTIKNRKTGKIERVTLEEAKKRGAMK